jgi:hypothetical protein
MPPAAAIRHWITADPRHGQIATLAVLLAWGVWQLDFDVTAAQAAVTIGTALVVQRLGDWRTGAPWRSGAKSALISSLSLCLLLRTDDLAWAAAGAALAVGSKFLLRVGGKHVFNPTNGALVALLLLTNGVWVSPGQWGTGASFAFAIASAGLAVVHRSARSDVTLAFITAYAALLVGRSLMLGEPLTIPLHRLESGAFLLFSFFMISDPKTTPDSRAGRVLFAALVAAGAWYVHFRLFRPNGFLWALAVASLLVPLIDRLLPARRYAWPRAVPLPRSFWRFPMTRPIALLLLALTATFATAAPAAAFCGFYVARAGSEPVQQARRSVVHRPRRRRSHGADDGRTTIRGEPRAFADGRCRCRSSWRRRWCASSTPKVVAITSTASRRRGSSSTSTPTRVTQLRDAPLHGDGALGGRGRRPRSRPSRTRRSCEEPRRHQVEARYTVGEYDILRCSRRSRASGLEIMVCARASTASPPGASAVAGAVTSARG